LSTGKNCPESAAARWIFCHPEGGCPEETPIRDTRKYIDAMISAVQVRGVSIEIEAGNAGS